MKAVENAGKYTTFVNDAGNTASLPSLRELKAYRLVPNGCFSGELAQKLAMCEEQNGKGSVADAYFVNRFGSNAYPFQNEVSIDNINEIPTYQVAMCQKIYSLLKRQIASAHKDDRAHYEYILLGLKQRLEK